MLPSRRSDQHATKMSSLNLLLNQPLITLSPTTAMTCSMLSQPNSKVSRSTRRNPQRLIPLVAHLRLGTMELSLHLNNQVTLKVLELMMGLTRSLQWDRHLLLRVPQLQPH
uniref:Non-structural protein NS-S n=1 Tax=Cacopsylla melanoneura TaxID=428564 RepID=A0A8D8UIY4_9HEMI